MITDWSIIKTRDWSFLIITSADMVKIFIQKGPYLPWKLCIKVRDYCTKHKLRVHDHLSFKIKDHYQPKKIVLNKECPKFWKI